MLRYKDKRFHIGGLSFVLPDDIIFSRKLCNKSGVMYMSADGKIKVNLNAKGYNGTLTDFLRDEAEKNLQVCDEIEIANMGDLDFAYLYGQNGKEECCMLVFSLPLQSVNSKMFSVAVTTKKGDISIKDAVKNPAVTDFISSIKKDLSASVLEI